MISLNLQLRIRLYQVLLLGFILTSLGCAQLIESDGLTLKNGLYYDSSSGELLDGKYKRQSQIGNGYAGYHISREEYINGVPIGTWSYSFNGDLISRGKYLDDLNTQIALQDMTNSLRVDLDLWQEGNYPILTINLIQPQISDSMTMKAVSKTVQQRLGEIYEFQTIYVDSVGDQKTERLFEAKLE